MDSLEDVAIFSSRSGLNAFIQGINRAYQRAVYEPLILTGILGSETAARIRAVTAETDQTHFNHLNESYVMGQVTGHALHLWALQSIAALYKNLLG